MNTFFKLIGFLMMLCLSVSSSEDLKPADTLAQTVPLCTPYVSLYAAKLD